MSAVRRRGAGRLGLVRARTLSVRDLRRAVVALAKGSSLPIAVEDVPERPRTRGDCVDGPRPCPWVSCRQNLYLDVNPETGSIKLNFPHLEPHEMAASCALDAAEAGGMSQVAVGEAANLSHERVRQLEVRALLKVGVPLAKERT